MRRKREDDIRKHIVSTLQLLTKIKTNEVQEFIIKRMVSNIEFWSNTDTLTGLGDVLGEVEALQIATDIFVGAMEAGLPLSDVMSIFHDTLMQ